MIQSLNESIVESIVPRRAPCGDLGADSRSPNTRLTIGA